MLTSITKIGNSKGVIIPAHLLKQCSFDQEVLLEVQDDYLIISNVKQPREGWKEAFERNIVGEENILMDDVSNDFDQDEWTW